MWAILPVLWNVDQIFDNTNEMRLLRKQTLHVNLLTTSSITWSMFLNFQNRMFKGTDSKSYTRGDRKVRIKMFSFL